MIAAVAAVLLLAVCLLLTWPLLDPEQDGAARANVLALPVGVLSFTASVVSGWLAWRALKPAPPLRELVRDLRDAVRRVRIATGDWRAGLTTGLSVGCVAGVMYALGVAGGTTWLRYALGVRSAARRDLLPRRPARFLD